MARLKTIGFELQSVTTGREMTTNGLNGGAISTTTVRTGAASLRINPTATFSWMKQVLKSSASATEIFIQAYIRFATLPASGQADIISVGDTVGVTLQCLAKLDSADNKVKVYDANSVLIGSSAALSTNTWYCLELRCIGGSGNATIQAKLDQTQFATSTTATMANFDGFYLGGAFNSGTYDMFYDDVIANDTSGSNETSWVGGQSVIVLKPDSAGDANTFATQTGGTAGAANNFTRVNETTPDDATTFNGSSTLNEEDLFNMGASGLSGTDTIKAVHIDLRFRNSTADATAVIKSEVMKTSGGTKAQSAALTPNSTTWKSNGVTTAFGHLQTLYADPDAGAWTNTTLDSMQAGYKLTTAPGTAGRRIDVSKVWVTVSYTPASATTNTKTVTAKARVKQGGVTKTVTSKGRIFQPGVTKTVTAKARVKQTDVTKTVTAKAKISILNTKTVTSKARIKQGGVTKTVTARGRIAATTATKTVTAKARVKSTGVTKTVTSKARLKTFGVTKTLTARGRIAGRQSGFVEMRSYDQRYQKPMRGGDF